MSDAEAEIKLFQAVVLQAIKDAFEKEKKREPFIKYSAREWLTRPDSTLNFYLSHLGIDREYFDRRMKNFFIENKKPKHWQIEECFNANQG